MQIDGVCKIHSWLKHNSMHLKAIEFMNQDKILFDIHDIAYILKK